MKPYVVFDMETDGLLDDVTKIHCLVIKYEGHLRKYFDRTTLSTSDTCSGSVASGVTDLRYYIKEGRAIVGHNICGFDLPVIKKVLGVKNFDPLHYDLIQDTYINTCMMDPESPFSLGYWGTIAGIPKPPHEDWTTFSQEMLDRCAEDVKINDWLWKRQVKKGILNECWTKARVLENRVSWIHSKQTQFGMRVDVIKAAALAKELSDKANILEAELHEELPMVVEPSGVTVTRPFLKSGLLSKMVIDWFIFPGPIARSKTTFPIKSSTCLLDPLKVVRICGPFSRITFTPVNLQSHPKVKELLLSLGWKPTEWNWKKEDDKSWTKMSPKLTEDSYSSLPKGVGAKLAEYLILQHRIRFIYNAKDPRNKGLLSFVRSDGRVPCDAFTCGTPTARYRHKGAFVNLPKVETKYGPEIRSLFCVPTGNLMLGTDLSGIEARIMAHYATFYDGGEYAKLVLASKDGVHDANAKALSCDRKTAKTFLYAISYGAGVTKLSQILGCTQPRARKLIKEFWKTNHGLAKLITALEAEYDRNKNWITGLDGRKLFIRQTHKLMNTLVQNAATVVFKDWMVRCYLATERIHRVNQLVAYHDELAFELEYFSASSAHELGGNLNRLLKDVANKYDIGMPIESDWKVGESYDQIH